MKTLDTRSATDEYISTHSLTFSTPDLILKEFVIWLCEQVNTRDEKEQVPRIMLYLKDKEDRHGNVISSKSKFCIECGSNLKTRSKFCTKCGTKQE
jgi:hypothetical protein